NRGATTVFIGTATATVPDHTTVGSGERSGGACGSASTCTAGATVSWSFGNINAGQSWSTTFAALVDTVSPPASGTLLHSMATVTTVGGGASATSDVVVSAAPPMLLGLVDGPDPVVPGAALTYTLRLGNPSG